MTGSTLDLFQSYLSNRTQVVEVNGQLSEKGEIKHGVPQGSILGPLLFLLYINDISNSSDVLKFFLFADDTTVYYSADPSDDNTETVLNREMEKVSSWLAANKLSLNVKKIQLPTLSLWKWTEKVLGHQYQWYRCRGKTHYKILRNFY